MSSLREERVIGQLSPRSPGSVCFSQDPPFHATLVRFHISQNAAEFVSTEPNSCINT